MLANAIVDKEIGRSVRLGGNKMEAIASTHACDEVSNEKFVIINMNAQKCYAVITSKDETQGFLPISLSSATYFSWIRLSNPHILERH